METLTLHEIENISGALSPSQAIKITLGLMALAATSPVVIGVGGAAIVSYAFMQWME
jgi:hypothetical protein